MATFSKNGASVYQGSKSGVNGPPNKFYNTDDKLVVTLDISGITSGPGLDMTGISLPVKLVNGASWVDTESASSQSALVIASSSVSMVLDGSGNASAQVIFEGMSSADLKYIVQPKIIVLGSADGTTDVLPDNGAVVTPGDFVIFGGSLRLDDGGEGVYHIMPGSQYISDSSTYGDDYDAGSRSQRVDTIQIKAMPGRRRVAPSEHVSTAGSDLYLDEVLDAFAGEIQRMKDIRGEASWDASSQKWYVDSHAQADGKGRFVIDPQSMALEAHGGLHSGLAYFGDDLSGKVVDLAVYFSIDSAVTDGSFDDPFGWVAGWNNTDVRSYISALAALSSKPQEIADAPEVPADGPAATTEPPAAAGSAEAWVLSRIPNTLGLNASGDMTVVGASMVWVGQYVGSFDSDDPIHVPGYLKNLGADASGSGTPRPSGSIYVAELVKPDHNPNLKLDMVRLAKDEDSVKSLLSASFSSDSVFNEDGKIGLDIVAALSELKASAGGGADGNDYLTGVSFNVGTNELEFSTSAGMPAIANVDLSSLVGSADLTGESIGSLSDVDISGIAAGQVLGWNGAQLTGVTPPSDDKLTSAYYTHSAANAKFTSAEIGTAGGFVIESMTDVNAAGNGIEVEISTGGTGVVASWDAGLRKITISIEPGQPVSEIITQVDALSDFSCVVDPINSDAAQSYASEADGTHFLAGGGNANTLNLHMATGSPFEVALGELIDSPDGNDNFYLDDVSLVGSQLQFTMAGGAPAVDPIDLSSLGGGGGYMDLLEEAIVGEQPAGTEIQFDRDIFPEMDGDDGSSVAGAMPAADLKKGLAVFRNGLRLASSDFILVGGPSNQDKLKFSMILNDGDYIMVEVKADPAA